MHRPVLVTPPEMLPVSLAEAKLHLRIEPEATLEDSLIDGLIKAATAHLDGWSGILGRCLVEQVWRQDFDAFATCLPLPLGPVISISSVTIGDDTIDPAGYTLKTDAGGRSRVEFAGVTATGAVSISYVAGYATIPGVPEDVGPPVVPAIPAKSTVPDAIKVAILLLVGAWYENREESLIGVVSAGGQAPSLPASVAVSALLAPYRRVGV